MLLVDLQKKYGENTILDGSKLTDSLRLKTGVFPVDLCTGGGFPIGKAVMLYGNRSSGKSTLAQITVGRFQRTCVSCWFPVRNCVCKKGKQRKGRVVYIDTEGSLDKAWALKLGVNLELLTVVRPKNAEEGVDIAAAVLEDPDVGLLVHDTIAMAITEDEIAKSANESVYAQHPKLITLFTKKIAHVTNQERKKGHLVTTIVVNQQRVSMQGMGKGPMSYAPGGKALEHFAQMILRMNALAMTYADKADKEKDAPLATNTRVVVERNKTGVSVMQGSYSIMVRPWSGYPEPGKPDDLNQIIANGQKYGYIARSKKGWQCGGHEFPTLDAMKRAWGTSDDIFEDDRDAILELSLKDILGV